MKQFQCGCGQRLFFDNTHCHNCGLQVGFDPARLEMISLLAAPMDELRAPDGQPYRLCRNGTDYDVCNWLVPANDYLEMCSGCQLTARLPALDSAENKILWGRLEAAKRRLLYSIYSLGLPITDQSGNRLTFEFLEDQRRNPDVLEAFVATGHLAGTITINLAEADDLERHAVREQMQERYRTLLGHFRHETAHFYFDVLVAATGQLGEFRALFGDETADYESAIRQHYSVGPRSGWSKNFVSAYASAHPHEDWAETFAHYLHIVDALETARTIGLATWESDGRTGWINGWLDLSITLNELNRSLGLDDPYPFVLTDAVIGKLRFIDRLVRQSV